MHLRHWEGAKLASSKIMSRSYFYSSYSYSCQKGSFYDTTVMVHVVDTTIYLIRTNCAYSEYMYVHIELISEKRE